MEVQATLRRLRMAPRKVRLVVDLVRGLPVAEAEVRLTFLQKEAARPVLKLLQSAMANAKHNFKLHPETLIIRSIAADDGPTYKRSTPKAFGRAGAIRKRTSHVTITLATKEDAPKKDKTKKEGKKGVAKKTVVKKEKPVAKKKEEKPQGTQDT